MINVYKIKQEICEIGDRLYKKGFAAANDGNISYRVSDSEIICTPTMISKGFMKPDDLCIVDMEGNQVSGRRERTSEIKLHLAILKERPDVKAVVHCHPPHATAFGIAREPVPVCVLPEVEFFLGEVPITKFAIPGSREFAGTVLPFVKKASAIILANHGMVSYGGTLEEAYWRTEILDAYCRVLMLARGLGRINYFTEPEAQAILELKRQSGYEDPRAGLENCDICANDVFRASWTESGVRQEAFCPPRFSAAEPPGKGPPSHSNARQATSEQEALVQAITDRVMLALGNGHKS